MNEFESYIEGTGHALSRVKSIIEGSTTNATSLNGLFKSVVHYLEMTKVPFKKRTIHKRVSERAEKDL